LFVVTTGAQAITDGAEVDPVQAALWGLGRVVALEHPDRWGGLIDLEPGRRHEAAAADLAAVLLAPGSEDQFAIRGSERWLARLVRTRAPRAAAKRLDGNGSYLVTGGLGGLGLCVAEWLASRGAGQVVLLSRRAWPPESLEGGAGLTSEQRGVAAALGRIEAGGSSVRVATGDVADEAALQALLATLAADGRPLRGVLHCAVAMTSAAVRELDLPALQSMFAAKIRGTEVLDRLTRDAGCDLFVLFSSTTALLGVAGLGHYAAANQFMDALAAERRRAGYHALSINWGTWDVMRVASSEDRQRFAAGGMRALPSEQAIAAMELAIAADLTNAVIADIDWAALKPLYEARRKRPFLAAITDAPANPTRRQDADDSIPARLQRAAANQRSSLLADYIGGAVSSVLGTTGPVAADRGFFDMGMDSLMAVELKFRLERDLGLELPSTLTFNYPSVAALAEMIGLELERLAPPSGAQVPSPRASDFRARITAAGEAPGRAILSEFLVREAAAILGRSPGTVIPTDRGLFDMGMDSLMAVELKSRLEKALACELPSTLTFNYPTIDAIVGYLASELLQAPAAPRTAPAVRTLDNEEPDSAASDELDADELARRLRRKLESMGFSG
jgi:acyl carrier protein/NAD(P)-dependent dehydrogenase (short-subunit alcohol dehydrogenase family)